MERRDLFALFDRAGDAAFAVEPHGRICFWSQSAEALLGFSQEQVLSKNCADILAGQDEAGCEVCSSDCHVIELACKDERVAAYDLHAATASGERKWLNVSVIVAHVKSGPSPLIVHLMRDIENRKSIEGLTRDIMVKVGDLTGRQADEVLRRGPARRPPVELTPREQAVLRALSLGRNTKEISAELEISSATVRNHIQRLLKKLQCHTRLEAVMRGARESLI
jgi:PAS domain S-box-containing protein